MACASSDSLLAVLLEHLDSDPTPVLSGADLPTLPAGALDALLGERLLTELAPLEEFGSCACAVDGCYRTIQRDGEKAWAFCANGLAAPLEPNLEELRQFRVEVSVFCQKLRDANQLRGDAIAQYSRTVSFLGETEVDGRVVSLVLARCLRPRSAATALHAMRGRWSERSLLVLTPTELALDPGLRADLKASELVVADLSGLLLAPVSLELALGQIGSLFSWSPAQGAGVVLHLDRRRRVARYQGTNLELARREMDLLFLLADHAVRAPNGWVERDRIYDVLWPGRTTDDFPYTRQIDQAVRNVRGALDAVEPGSGRRVIQTLRGTGYRLTLPSRSIVLV